MNVIKVTDAPKRIKVLARVVFGDSYRVQLGEARECYGTGTREEDLEALAAEAMGLGI